MADAVSVTNMPDSGSREAVAFRLWQAVRAHHGYPQNMQADLDLFSECLEATHRGKAKVAQPT